MTPNEYRLLDALIAGRHDLYHNSPEFKMGIEFLAVMVIPPVVEKLAEDAIEATKRRNELISLMSRIPTATFKMDDIPKDVA